MEFLIIGIVSALNLIIIVHKFKKGRVEDGIFDSILFGFMAVLFSGSYGGMVVAMISSLIISIYLWASPPAFFKAIVRSDDVQNALKDVKSFTTPANSKKSKKPEEELHFD